MLNIYFRPAPNYAALAKAEPGSDPQRPESNSGASWMKGQRVSTIGELKQASGYGVKKVHGEEEGTLIEALM